MMDSGDSTLVEQALAGHNRSFDLLVDKYYKIVYNVALKMVFDRENAADITQSVFLKAYTNLKSFNKKYKFFSWVYRIAVNESLNFLNGNDQRTELLDDSIASEQTPETIALQSDLETKIESALSKLRPDNRAVIVLAHYQGLSYREIAETLGIAEKTVKSRLFTSRQMLKEILLKDRVIDV